MKKVKIGIIGIGNMGSSHALNIVKGKVKNAELTAVCDIDNNKLEWSKNKLNKNIGCYNDPDQFLAKANIDSVIIATPHYDHPSLAIKGFERGLNVLIEKPAGVYTKNVRKMNEMSKKSDKKFAIMYNQRTRSVYKKLKDLIDSGEIGEIKRSNWIIDWYRPQSYYNSGGWRATWKGEGGGVLLNQDPHQLDIWQWVCGMPKKIRAFSHFGKYHDIEVEDDVTAYVEYENGATGVFITSTGIAPETNRLEITGDRGKLIVENNKIVFRRLRTSERQFNQEYQGGFGSPECWEVKIPLEEKNPGHIGILNNWIDAIINDVELISPGIEGINGLIISNAMHLSSWTDNWVNLPINEDLYYDKLQEKIKESTFKKNKSKSEILEVSDSH